MAVNRSVSRSLPFRTLGNSTKWHRHTAMLAIIEFSCLWELGTCVTSVVWPGQFPGSLCNLLPLSYWKAPARRKGTNWKPMVYSPLGRKLFRGSSHNSVSLSVNQHPSIGSQLSAEQQQEWLKKTIEIQRNKCPHWKHCKLTKRNKIKRNKILGKKDQSF